MTMQQISILILVVGFALIGLILFAAYKVAEYKDMKKIHKSQR